MDSRLRENDILLSNSLLTWQAKPVHTGYIAMKKLSARKSSVKIKTRPIHFHPFIIGAITFCLGVVAVFVMQQVFAGNNDFIIHGCVDKVNGNLRIVASGTSCRNNETSLDWNQQGPQGPAGPAGNSTGNGLPYACNTCELAPFASAFKGKDFSGSQIQNSDFTGADLSGVIFKNAFFSYDQFNNANLTGSDFSNIKDVGGFLGSVTNLKFASANLTNANFSNSNFSSSDFSNTNLQGANFTDTTFTGDNFSGAQNMSSANTTGVTWNNVTCPDGTKSNSDGGTCVGHF